MQRSKISIIVAGGGTGGHLFPAISVVKELEKRAGHCRVLFIVGRQGRGAEIISKHGYQLEMVDVEGMKGRGWKNVLLVLSRLPKSVIQSMGHIHRFGPDVVFGVGGYSAGPVCMAARIRGIPTAIHEQNAIPGITNRILATIVDRVFVSFDQTRQLLKRPGAIVTGTPIRQELLMGMEAQGREEGKFTVLVMGGSQGAKAINRAFTQALYLLKSKGQDIDVIHQTGQADYHRTLQDYDAKGLEGQVIPFIEDMAQAYSRAHLVICRAGASTIFELAMLRKPAIVIPYPFAANRHQDLNAKALADTGGAVVLFEKDMDGNRLAELIDRTITDRNFLKYSRAVSGLARHNAAADIADQLMDLAA